MTIFEKILAAFGILFDWHKVDHGEDIPVPPPVPSTPPLPPQPVPIPHPTLVAGVDLRGHSHLWRGGTLVERKAMYQLAKRICEEEAPQFAQDVLLTIYGESGFNQWCINTETFDYGLCQFSKIFYLKEYKMTAQEAIDNPERCVRIMARNFKAGRQSNWVAYKKRMQFIQAIKELN